MGSRARVFTVTGEVSATELGVVLAHEHVMVDFIGAHQVGRHRYNPDGVFEVVLPYARRKGVS
ncbi:MAG: hypothetical protein C4335_01880 [Armatimonadota bacterium]